MNSISHNIRYLPHDLITRFHASKTYSKFYQYTIIDEATRERFIYAYDYHSSFSTVDFVLHAITTYSTKNSLLL